MMVTKWQWAGMIPAAAMFAAGLVCAKADGAVTPTPSRGGWGTLVIASQRAVKTDLTIPSNVCLKFENGGAFDVGAGAALTINGSVEAPLQQLFRGSGKVLFGSGRVKEVYPQWWGARAQGRSDDTAAIQAAIDSQPKGGAVFFPRGTYRVSSAIRFRDRLRLISDGARLQGPAPAMLQSSNPDERCNNVRIRGLTLDGLNRDAGAVGLDLTNVSYGAFEDLDVINCGTGVLMDRACMYNIFTNVGIGACTTAIQTDGSTNATRIFGGRIGNVATGLLVNTANDLQIYGLSIEVFGTGIDIRRGDTVHMYNIYFAGGTTGIRIVGARQVSECTIVNPRYSQVAIEMDDQAEDTLVLDNAHPSKSLRTQALFATGISATDARAANLCGGVAISGESARAVVRFATAEPDDEYRVVATCVSVNGTPRPGATSVRIEGKSAVGFELVLADSPGAGNSVSVDWLLVR